MTAFSPWLLVALGASVGAPTRYLMDDAVSRWTVSVSAVSGRAQAQRAQSRRGETRRAWLSSLSISFPGFPWGTLVVNCLGTAILGVLTALYVISPGNEPVLITPTSPWYVFLAVGFCGTVTTFSTFAWETAVLSLDRKYAATVLYVGGSIGLSFGLFVICFAVTRELLFL